MLRRLFLGLVVPCLACGAGETGASRDRPGVVPDQEGPVFYESGTSAVTSAPPNVLDGLVDGVEPEPNRTITIDQACVIDEADAVLVKQPVDIILLLDNSGSMEDEAAAVEANINVNFASVLENSGVDYRVILISRHRRGPREESGESSTSICVQTPLSGLASCDDADEPVFSERFFQYSTKVESHDSFDIALDTYDGQVANEDREEKFDQAPLGWSEWLRPDAKKVFLEVTDDDELLTDEDDDDIEDNEEISATEFARRLTTLAPQHFGSDPLRPNFVFHSIVGLAEKDPATAAYLPEEAVQAGKCTGNDGDVTNSGETYQELSRLTGGLRLPLCQFDAYDVVFQRIAEDVVLTRGVACDFPIPDPPRGEELDLNNIAISYLGSGGKASQFGQAPTVGDCQADAFYVDGSRLALCPSTCSRVSSDPLAAVTVLFTCESQLIVPR
ncbi:MAG TPA: hypothetical protein VJU61_21790 [Polyangiaceae bacterium]|nr:hypothetical protein [Polyangiaceae bacterium]